ncbi:hypothetical protein GCM10011532_23020 [Christiangramia forsetii]|uniref:AB hydrolase-1 domain-containing protein n=1 Tax=Christiangramia forsetii TaxID=411153 RepID=A0ABQ1WP23_9FLAO|nr:hypothetical protein GCM10011532_23020 [Christiangramia forsetii]
MIENSSAQQKEIFEYSDGKIAYQTFGKGFPVLIINGGPGMNSNGFASLAKMLSENNTTIIYDQRGTGKSKLKELNASNMTIDLMVEDIEVLRQELGFEQWIVLGQSFGGMLAYAYAAKYPERVNAMIQSHSGGMSLRNVGSFSIMNRLTEAENDSLVHYSAMMHTSPGNPRLAKKRAYFMAKAYLAGTEHENTVAERLLEVNRDLNSMIWGNMRSNNFDKTPEMREFQNKVLIIHGLQDVVPIEIAEFAHEVLSNSELLKIEDCGHYGWLDRPDVYLKKVKEFLKANSININP